MSSIDNQNILSPMQANRAEMNTILTDETAPVASHNAFNIDWFVLSGDRITSNPLTKTAVSAIDTTNFGNTTLGSDRKLEIMAPVNSMESRVERIVQYILPRD